MSIYAKLAKARVDLQQIEMSKSGLNKFAHFNYFELSDMIPHINRVMQANGLCGVISFSPEQAELVIFDTESDSKIFFYSPIADATVKGATPIQCLGSMHTYMRRYLWMLALEIVEHDAVDAQPQEKPKAEKPKLEKSETDYAQLLQNSKSINELLASWQVIPAGKRKQYEKIKNDMKELLSNQDVM